MSDTVETIAGITIVVALVAAYFITRSTTFSFEQKGSVGGKIVAWAMRVAVFWLVWIIVGAMGAGLIELAELAL